jgi:hypothetical protein
MGNLTNACTESRTNHAASLVQKSRERFMGQGIKDWKGAELRDFCREICIEEGHKHERLKLPHESIKAMPQLYRELSEQLSQWVIPSDRRHLQVLAEILGAILSSGSGCLSHWLPYLSHRDCQARSHLERLSYFLHNPAITSTQYAAPLIRGFLHGWSGQAMLLVLDTSMLNDDYCLIEICLVWGGRSLPLAQIVLKHASATVGFEQYRPVLEAVKALLPEAVEAYG